MIPLDKLSDFGAHANSYYQLNLKYFITDADKKVLKDIISRSWGEALMTNPLTTNAQFLSRLMEQATQKINHLQINKSSFSEIESLRNLLNRISQDRKAGIIIQKMKQTVFG